MGVPLGRPILKELLFEAATTGRLLACMPPVGLTWRPHERSMSLGRLGSHIAEIARYGSLVLRTDRLDSEVRTQGPLDLDSLDEIVATFESHVTDFAALLGVATDDQLRQRWQYCKGERVILDLRRISALRTFVLNHLVHHRGQLSVYLRLLDVALPQVYGPTADDGTGY
jgi:uncharacterized damage-inducible protein DinB